MNKKFKRTDSCLIYKVDRDWTVIGSVNGRPARWEWHNKDDKTLRPGDEYVLCKEGDLFSVTSLNEYVVTNGAWGVNPNPPGWGPRRGKSNYFD